MFGGICGRDFVRESTSQISSEPNRAIIMHIFSNSFILVFMVGYRINSDRIFDNEELFAESQGKCC